MFDVLNFFRASRKRPQRAFDGKKIYGRATHYGDLMAMLLGSRDEGYADEGSYFLIKNPTLGTGLATIAAPTALADTSPFILIKNNSPLDDPQRISFKYLRLTCTAAGTAGTAIRFAAKTDAVNPTRYTSGATGIYAPPTTSSLVVNNVNQDSAEPPGILAYAGPIVAAAATGDARELDHLLIRPVIPVVGDEYLINFGSTDGSVGGLAPAGVAIATPTFVYHPVIIGPQQWAAFHLVIAGQSAASSWEFSLGYTKR